MPDDSTTDRGDRSNTEDRLKAHMDKIVAEIQQQRLVDQLENERTYATRASQHENRNFIQAASGRVDLHERKLDLLQQDLSQHKQQTDRTLARIEKSIQDRDSERSQGLERLRQDVQTLRVELKSDASKAIEDLRDEMESLRKDLTDSWAANRGFLLMALLNLAGIVLTFLIAHAHL